MKLLLYQVRFASLNHKVICDYVYVIGIPFHGGSLLGGFPKVIYHQTNQPLTTHERKYTMQCFISVLTM